MWSTAALCSFPAGTVIPGGSRRALWSQDEEEGKEKGRHELDPANTASHYGGRNRDAAARPDQPAAHIGRAAGGADAQPQAIRLRAAAACAARGQDRDRWPPEAAGCSTPGLPEGTGHLAR